MTKETKIGLGMAIGLLAAFGLWTAAVCGVDVQPIGPGGSMVGFATLNGCVHRMTGVHLWLYVVTDWLSLVPVGFVAGFGLLGLGQWISRKHVLKVDYSILVLGGFYLLVLAMYILFETVVINYRPVLIDGRLEASYPSSTTMLVLCVMPTTAMQLRQRMEDGRGKRWAICLINAYTALMVVGRLVSGVHWCSDIIGGALLSAGLVMLYRVISNIHFLPIRS